MTQARALSFSSRIGPVLILLVAMTSIQLGASLAKQLFPYLGAVGATTLRLSLATLLLFSIWRPWRISLLKRQKYFVVGYGVCLGGMNLLFYLALERIPQGIAVALEFTGPLAVAISTSRTSRDYLWGAMAIVGLVLLLPFSELSPQLDLLGVIYALGAGVCWAFYIVFGKRAGANSHAGIVTALGMMIATFAILPVNYFHAGSEIFQISLLPLGLTVALLSSALPYSLEMVALKRMPTQTFGIFMSLEPAIAAMSGSLLLSEQLDLTQIAAIGLIIAASSGTTVTTQSKPPSVQPQPV